MLGKEVVGKYTLTATGLYNKLTKAELKDYANRTGDFAVFANIFVENIDELMAAGATAEVKVVEAKANAVEIFNVGATYKAKALKKAKKSFTLKAEATNGTVTFKKVAGSSKLSIKNGKIVVKKGTKKGTYKINVKASVAAGNGYKAASTTKVIKVVVK